LSFDVAPAALVLYQGFLSDTMPFSLANMFFTVLAWLLIVALALWAIDRLFPRIQRNRDKRTERDA
jgi:fucose permease